MNFGRMRFIKRGLLRLSLTFLLVLAVAVFAPGAFELPLKAGWNLVSLPEFQSNPDIRVVVESINTKVSSVWSFENGEWLSYSPDFIEMSTLLQMNSGKGYWILMSEDGVLFGNGMKQGCTVQLNEGWNLIGFPGSTENQISELLQTSASGID